MTWRRCCSMSCAPFSLRRRPQKCLSLLVCPHNPPQAHLVCFLILLQCLCGYLLRSALALLLQVHHTLDFLNQKWRVLSLSIVRKMKSCERPVREPSIDIDIPVLAYVLQSTGPCYYRQALFGQSVCAADGLHGMYAWITVSTPSDAYAFGNLDQSCL